MTLNFFHCNRVSRRHRKAGYIVCVHPRSCVQPRDKRTELGISNSTLTKLCELITTIHADWTWKNTRVCKWWYWGARQSGRTSLGKILRMDEGFFQIIWLSWLSLLIYSYLSSNCDRDYWEPLWSTSWTSPFSPYARMSFEAHPRTGVT